MVIALPFASTVGNATVFDEMVEHVDKSLEPKFIILANVQEPDMNSYDNA